VQLPELLKSKRTAIAGRWTDLALEVYPLDSSGFLRQEKDRFRNPVGQITRESLETLFEGLLAGLRAEEMKEALDAIVRIRAVQDLSPAQALGFVFLLKRVVREELGEAATEQACRADLSALHDRIDRLALQAFGLFVECRERIHDLRVREFKRRTSRLLKLAEKLPAGRREAPAGSRPGQHEKGGCGA
jgi:hypothetical protein